jgi:hypothetical protein
MVLSSIRSGCITKSVSKSIGSRIMPHNFIWGTKLDPLSSRIEVRYHHIIHVWVTEEEQNTTEEPDHPRPSMSTPTLKPRCWHPPTIHATTMPTHPIINVEHANSFLSRVRLHNFIVLVIMLCCGDQASSSSWDDLGDKYQCLSKFVLNFVLTQSPLPPILSSINLYYSSGVVCLLSASLVFLMTTLYFTCLDTFCCVPITPSVCWSCLHMIYCHAQDP